VVKRARALLGVQTGQSFTEAAREAGYQSGDSVSQLVERFHQHGFSALLIAPGRGRKPTYTSEQRVRIVAELQREPDREKDQTATWSLMLLRNALRKTELPHVAKETIRVTLHEAGYAFGKTRTWCLTGTALRKRKAGVVPVHDPAALYPLRKGCFGCTPLSPAPCPYAPTCTPTGSRMSGASSPPQVQDMHPFGGCFILPYLHGTPARAW
jgi:transposase